MTIHESTGAYLLGALPDDERAEFEVHLASCEDCRREVAELRIASDALPVAVEQMAAPQALRDRIMATVNSEAELLSAAGAGADRVAPQRRERRVLGWWRPSLGLAAAFACALALAVSATVLLDGDSRRVVTASSAPAGARVSLEVTGDRSRLLAENLPAPPAGRVYQVWLVRGQDPPEPTDALFTPRGGRATVDVPSVEGVDAVLVTQEPRQGSQAPTTEPVIAVQPS